MSYAKDSGNGNGSGKEAAGCRDNEWPKEEFLNLNLISSHGRGSGHPVSAFAAKHRHTWHLVVSRRNAPGGGG
ncbi:hypothetical protein FRC16_008280, partial [Serendipita sp. 398]